MPTSFAKLVNDLCEYVKDTIRLDTPIDGGKSRRQIVEQSLKLMKNASPAFISRLREEITTVDLPRGTEYLIAIFGDLSSYRTYGAMGNQLPLTLLDIKAYCELIQPLTPWEISVIRRMDDAYLSAHSKGAK